MEDILNSFGIKWEALLWQALIVSVFSLLFIGSIVHVWKVKKGESRVLWLVIIFAFPIMGSLAAIFLLPNTKKWRDQFPDRR